MKEVIEAARVYRYSSVQYVEDKDFSDAFVYKLETDFLLFYQVSAGLIVAYWAAESRKGFIDELKGFVNYSAVHFPDKKLQIGFIPGEFVNDLMEIGFEVASEFIDFWKHDLYTPNFQIEKKYSVRPIYLDKEYSTAGAITRACMGSSRGFKGETDDWVKEWGESKDSNILVLESGSEIVGACFVRLYGFDSEKGIVLWIRELAVEPSHNRKGIGKTLLKYAIDWGRMNGAKRSFLACDLENVNAIRLYEYFGYTSTKEQSEITMLLHHRVESDIWRLPGGAMELGETLEETAIREE